MQELKLFFEQEKGFLIKETD